MSKFSAYTDVITRHRLDVLQCLRDMLKNERLQNRAQFSNLMKAVFSNGYLNPRDLSNDMGFNVSTVYRWIENRTAPHLAVWPLIQDWLLQKISDEINKINEINEINGVK